MRRTALTLLTAAAALMLQGCVGTVVGAAANTAVGVGGAVAGAGVKATTKTAGAAGRTVFIAPMTDD